MHRTTGDNYALDSQGRRVFTAGPPPTTLDEGWANAVQEEIARAIEASGQTLAEGPGSDTMGQLAIAIQKVAAYDSIVYSQETFNAVWERTAANAYKLRDEIGSIYFKAYPGGYNMSGPSSPLSGGDTWGVFSTNLCTFVMCDGGNFFQMGDTPSYWSIATSNTVVYNMDIRGVGAVAAAISYTIKIENAAIGAQLLFPKISKRYSNAIHYVISSNNVSGSVVGAEITDCVQSGNTAWYGIYLIERVLDCKIFSCAHTTTGTVICIYGIPPASQYNAVSNCYVADISSAGIVYVYLQCTTVSSCIAKNISSSGDDVFAFRQNITTTASYALGISSSAKSAFGFYDCENVSGCKAYDIETSINSASYKAVGFQDCDQLSACTADTIAASAANAYSYGFNTCKRLSACYAVTVTAVTASRAYGYYSCTHMDGSCEAATVDDFEFYTCSNEPFKGNAAATTPYGYTEVYTSQVVANGSTITVTPTKDCLLFGYLRQPTGGAVSTVTIRVGASGKTTDQIIQVAKNYVEYAPFYVPCKAGMSVYFAFVSSANSAFWVREMPFGTTT